VAKFWIHISREEQLRRWARTKVLAKLVKILSTEMGHQPADPLRRKQEAETPRKKKTPTKN